MISNLVDAIKQLAICRMEKNEFSDNILSKLLKCNIVEIKDGYVELTQKRGMSCLYHLEAIKEESTLSPELEEFLTNMEKIEAEYINLGFYDIMMTSEDLANRLSLNLEEVETYLKELANREYVLKLQDFDGKVLGYRSRIAEIVRLISLLKQRFSRNDIDKAPNLVRSVKLIIKDRYVTRRSEAVDEVLNKIKGYLPNSLKSYWEDFEEDVKLWLLSVGIKKLSVFQRTSVEKIMHSILELGLNPIKREKAFALVAETGAGKTEAYLLPIMLMMVLNKLAQHGRIRLFVVYPRIALSINQLSRFTKYAYALRNINSKMDITIGIDNKYIPENFKVLNMFFDKYEYNKAWILGSNVAIFKHLHCPVLCELDDEIKFECLCNVYYDAEENVVKCEEGHVLPIKLFKESAYNVDTDILIVTPNTLMRRLIERKFIDLINNTDIVILALDECHLYRGLPGSNTSLVIRRLRKLIKELGKKLIIINISATMASPEDFLKELTGLTPEIIQPNEEELERKSVEYFILVKPESVSLTRVKITEEEEEEEEEKLKPIKPISTMIQTVMCVLHNMKRTQFKYKGLGFVDSIDTLHRWYRYQCDAEKRKLPLFKLRTDYVSPPQGFSCDDCKDGPMVNCPIYQVGECWFFAKFDKTSLRLNEPLRFQIYYSERREELEDVDCILSTSALEVGYDDPSLIAFFQYKSPKSIISFAQRKGRVARSPEDRPIHVIVLSPYSRRDNFIFQNEDYIINSDYNEIPLNYENYFAQRDHASCLLYTSPSPRDLSTSRMPSSA